MDCPVCCLNTYTEHVSLLWLPRLLSQYIQKTCLSLALSVSGIFPIRRVAQPVQQLNTSLQSLGSSSDSSFPALRVGLYQSHHRLRRTSLCDTWSVQEAVETMVGNGSSLFLFAFYNPVYDGLLQYNEISTSMTGMTCRGLYAYLCWSWGLWDDCHIGTTICLVCLCWSAMSLNGTVSLLWPQHLLNSDFWLCLTFSVLSS